jgi:predicted RNA-binding protein YlqC (UPF0109 family)
MSTTESNPFAEPDFSGVEATTGDDDLADEEYDEYEDDAEGDDEAEAGAESAAAPEVTAEQDDEDDEDDAGNRMSGGTARAVLEHVAKSIVDEPEGVEVDVAEGRSGVRLSLHVAQGDMGRIIGRRGRTAQALRTLVRAAAARDGQEASVDIVD